MAERKPAAPKARKSPKAKSSKMPTARVSRAAKISKTLGTGGVGLASTRVANVARGDSAAEEAMRRRHAKNAETLVKTLGSMRGAATKLGQVASFVDVEVLPEEYRDIYQNELSKLRSHAPTMSWKQIAGVLKDAFDVSPKEIFSDFDREAVAAASIGQVHKAVLRSDGTEVAVKLQYPEIADALRADLQNVGIALRLGKAFAPGLEVKAVAKELKTRVLEELDYELEAGNQRRFERAYRGHPFIRVPRVYPEYSSERVLVSEWVDGEPFETVLKDAKAARDRFGEIIYRFSFGSIYHVRQLNADAHPGNYLRMSDGRVAFLDFGMTKRVTREQIQLQVAVIAAALDDDAERLVDALDELGFLADRDHIEAAALMEHVRAVGGWYMNGRKTQITSHVVARVIGATSDPRSRHFKLLRKEKLPADELMGRRMETGVLAVLGKLRASANWTRIGREWWFGDRPATELGKAEWEYFEERGIPHGPAVDQ